MAIFLLLLSVLLINANNLGTKSGVRCFKEEEGLNDSSAECTVTCVKLKNAAMFHLDYTNLQNIILKQSSTSLPTYATAIHLSGIT